MVRIGSATFAYCFNTNICFCSAPEVNTVIEDEQEAAISTFDVFDTASLEQSTTNMVNDIAMLRKFCEDQIVQKAMEKKKKQESTGKRNGHGRHESLKLSAEHSGTKSTQKNIVVTPKGTDRSGDESEGKSGK